MRRTVTFKVTVELDDVPGAMHTENSAKAIVSAVLQERLYAYEPVVQELLKPHCGHTFYKLTKGGSAACGEMDCNNYIH